MIASFLVVVYTYPVLSGDARVGVTDTGGVPGE